MSQPNNKLTPGLTKTLRSAGPSQEPLSIIVRYGPDRRIMRHRGPMRGVRYGYDYHLRPFSHMHATPEAIARLQADPDIVRIYEDLPVHTCLDHSVPQLRVPELWEEGLTGRNVRIAIVDTGIDPRHPDLIGRIGGMANFTGQADEDQNGHGTHCASIAAGSGAASGSQYRGVAPEATIYVAKVLGAHGEGMMSDVMAGVEWAVDQGVQVISLSLGSAGPCDGTDALSETCDAAMEQGIIVVVAAGNEGPGGYTVGAPGCARRVITIGACDDRDHVASFSSRGPTSDGRTKPDVLLPGVDIIAARAQDTAMGTPISEDYTSASGTSMATPHAAGICALLLEAEPELTPDQIKARLMETAIDLGESPFAQGQGRVDAYRARHSDVEPGPEPPPTPGPEPGTGCLLGLMRLFLIGKD